MTTPTSVYAGNPGPGEPLLAFARARRGLVSATSYTPPAVNEHLMEALLYAALFFGTSTDDECDPDLAVKQLEAISWSLQQMSPVEQETFRSYAYRAADEHPSPAVGDEIRTLVDGLLPSDDE